MIDQKSGFMTSPKILHSEEAERGAELLIQRLERVDIGIEVLPNVYKQFSGKMEEKDYHSYCSFLYSAVGRNVMEMLEESDERELPELW